jgi:hypothetical protein
MSAKPVQERSIEVGIGGGVSRYLKQRMVYSIFFSWRFAFFAPLGCNK